ncbi:MAG TPA: F0F1 ATP synthase subunit B [Ignavibacteriales bacterium]|jgi:F-type H+-transporting ATPase subunit b|nr:F0F1 ATP synthase subunit B [Ignavibacteriales bacterium]
MIKILFLFSTTHGEGPNAQGSLLEVNYGLIFFTLITFFILLFLLKKFAWKPILTALDEREKFIENSLKKAELAQKEAEELARKNKEALDNAQNEVAKILADGKKYADEVKEKLVIEAKAEAEKIKENAKLEAEKIKQELYNQLKSEMVDIVVSATEKFLKNNINADQHKEIINKYIDNIN